MNYPLLTFKPLSYYVAISTVTKYNGKWMIYAIKYYKENTYNFTFKLDCGEF